MKVEAGKRYRHFKGNVVKVIAVGKHTETMENMVVYNHDDTIWIRPYNMFISKVDKEKYPDIDQEYRFEEVDDNAWENNWYCY